MTERRISALISGVLLLLNACVSQRGAARDARSLHAEALQTLERVERYGGTPADVARAKETFRQSIDRAKRLNVGYAPPHYGLARAVSLEGDIRLAEFFVNEAIRIDDTYSDAYFFYVRVVSRNAKPGWNRVAEELLDEASELLTNDPTLTLAQSLLYAYNGEYENARALLTNLSELDAPERIIAEQTLASYRRIETYAPLFEGNYAHLVAYPRVTPSLIEDVILPALNEPTNSLSTPLTPYEAIPNKPLTKIDALRVLSARFSVPNASSAFELPPDIPVEYADVKPILALCVEREYISLDNGYLHPFRYMSVLDFVVLYDSIRTEMNS